MNNFEQMPLNSKVQSYDKDGYFIMPMCGHIVEKLGNGHAIIKSFDGFFYSSMGIRANRIAEIEILNN